MIALPLTKASGVLPAFGTSDHIQILFRMISVQGNQEHVHTNCWCTEQNSIGYLVPAGSRHAALMQDPDPKWCLHTALLTALWTYWLMSAVAKIGWHEAVTCKGLTSSWIKQNFGMQAPARFSLL